MNLRNLWCFSPLDSPVAAVSLGLARILFNFVAADLRTQAVAVESQRLTRKSPLVYAHLLLTSYVFFDDCALSVRTQF